MFNWKGLCILWGLMFSQWCCLWLKSSRMSHGVVGPTVKISQGTAVTQTTYGLPDCEDNPKTFELLGQYHQRSEELFPLTPILNTITLCTHECCWCYSSKTIIKNLYVAVRTTCLTTQYHIPADVYLCALYAYKKTSFWWQITHKRIWCGDWYTVH
jgi:hypothetical protein